MKSSLLDERPPIVIVFLLILVALLNGCRDSRPDRGLGVRIKGEGCELIRIPDYWQPEEWMRSRSESDDPIRMASLCRIALAWRARSDIVREVDELLLAAQFVGTTDLQHSSVERNEDTYSANKYAFRLVRSGRRRVIAPTPHRMVPDDEWEGARPIACAGCEPLGIYPRATISAQPPPSDCGQTESRIQLAGTHFLTCTVSADQRWLAATSYDGPRQPSGFLAPDFSISPRTTHIEYFALGQKQPSRLSHSSYDPGVVPVGSGVYNLIQNEFFITWPEDVTKREALVCSMPVWEDRGPDDPASNR
jgi:hypothetical protein